MQFELERDKKSAALLPAKIARTKRLNISSIFVQQYYAFQRNP